MCKQQALLKVTDIQYVILQHLDGLHIACVLMYFFSCYHHKQLNDFNEQAALMSSPKTETLLLIFAHNQFAMPRHSFTPHDYV